MALSRMVRLPNPEILGIDPKVKQYLRDLNAAVRDAFQNVIDNLLSNVDTGTLVIDDGTTQMTMTVVKGKIETVATAASVGAGITWT